MQKLRRRIIKCLELFNEIFGISWFVSESNLVVPYKVEGRYNETSNIVQRKF
jgi:hypothetical protein